MPILPDARTVRRSNRPCSPKLSGGYPHLPRSFNMVGWVPLPTAINKAGSRRYFYFAVRAIFQPILLGYKVSYHISDCGSMKVVVFLSTTSGSGKGISTGVSLGSGSFW